MEVSAHSFTVNYASRRSEVWRWYWRAWAKPAGLWRIQFLLGFSCAFVFTLLRNHERREFSKAARQWCAQARGKDGGP
jgi:hypothetical protein